MKDLDSDPLRSLSLDINRAVAASSSIASLREALVDIVQQYYVFSFFLKIQGRICISRQSSWYEKYDDIISQQRATERAIEEYKLRNNELSQKISEFGIEKRKTIRKNQKTKGACHLCRNSMHPVFSEIEKQEKDYGKLESTFLKLEKQGTDLMKKKDLVAQDNKLMQSDANYLQQMAQRLTENYQFIKKENLENSTRQKRELADKKQKFKDLSALLSSKIQTSLLGDQKNVDPKQLLRYEMLIKENLRLHEQNIDLRSKDHILAPLSTLNTLMDRDTTNRKTLSINSSRIVKGTDPSYSKYNSARISKIPTLDNSIDNPGSERYTTTDNTDNKQKKKKQQKGKKGKKEKCSLI